MRLLSLFIIVPVTCLAYDVELKGAMRIGRDFLNILKQPQENEVTFHKKNKAFKMKDSYTTVDTYMNMDNILRAGTTGMTNIPKKHSDSKMNTFPKIGIHIKKDPEMGYSPEIDSHEEKLKSKHKKSMKDTETMLDTSYTKLHTKKYAHGLEELKDNSSNIIYSRAKDFLPTRTQKLLDYVYHVLKKGINIFKHTGKDIKNEMRLQRDITHVITNATEDFINRVQEYLNVVSREKTKYEIDEEYVFLDIVETLNRLLYGGQKKLLDDIVQEANNSVSPADMQLVNRKIYEEIVSNKKLEMKYICDNYQVCRQYPSFIDYCADFISEILKMSDSKFEIIIEIVKDILVSKKHFIDSFLRTEDKDILVYELDNFLHFIQENSNMREFLMVSRAVMTQRFKIVHSSDDVLKTRTKAVRILLDIVDRAISNEREYIMSIDFSNTVQAIRYWVNQQNIDIEKILRNFIENIIQTLDFNSSENTKMEVKTLIEVILRGRTENHSVHDYLIKFGSKFVRGEEDATDVEFI